MDVTTERVLSSAITIANAADLTTRIVQDLSGGEIASTLNNSQLTSDAIRGLAISRMQQNLTKLKSTEY